MVLGPTMPDNEILFNTDMKTVGLTFISSSIGYVTGSLLSGVIIDRFNQELIFGLAGIVSSAAIGASTFMGGVIPFIISFGVANLCNGICESGKVLYRETAYT